MRLRLLFLSIWSSGRVITTFHEQAEMGRPIIIGARGILRTDLGSMISILEHSGRLRPGSSMVILDEPDLSGKVISDNSMSAFEKGMIMGMTGSAGVDDYIASRDAWTGAVVSILSKKNHPDVLVVPFYVLFNEWLPMRAPHDMIRSVDMIAPAGETMPGTHSSYLILNDFSESVA